MIEAGRGVLNRELGRLFGEGTLSLSGGQLLERYLSQRDEASFEALVLQHGPMVLSLCRRYLRDPNDVADAFQATFLVLVRKGPSIRQRHLLSSWLFGVAYKVSLRARSQRQKRRGHQIDELDTLESPASLAPLESEEVGQILDQELSRLPEKYRVPLVLCYLNERTHEQAAAELQWPVGTVRSRLARGRELLRDRLTRRGYAPSAAILGLRPDLSPHPFTSQVPPALVRATVAAAERFLPAASAGAGIAARSTVLFPSLSGSATTLAQGVLSTMALTQMKVIGAGLVAAGMLAGGVGVGALALGSSGPGTQADKVGAVAARSADRPAVKPSENPPVPTMIPPPAGVPRDATPNPGTASVSDLEARLANLEKKLDRLLELRDPPTHPEPLPPRADVGPDAPSDPFARDVSHRQPHPRPVPEARPSPGPQPPPEPRIGTDLADESAPPVPAGSDSLPRAPERGLPVPSANQPDLTPRAEPSEVPPPRPARSQREPSPFDQDQPAPTDAPRSRGILPSPGMPVRDRAPDPGDELQEVRPTPPTRESGLEPAGPDMSAQRSGRGLRGILAARLAERTSLRELEAEVQAAIRRHQRQSAMFKQGMVGRDVLESTADELRFLDGRLRGLDDDLAEERDLLKVERVRKQAELTMAEAQAELATSRLARANGLFTHNAISRDEMARCETDAKIAPSQKEAKRAEMQEVELRMAQIDRRRSAIQSVLGTLAKTVPGLNERGE
jgi:RNA polymerase sigma factor (sigma-70 family)